LENKKRYTIKNILLVTAWSLLAAASVVLLVAAMQKKEEKLCREVNINIQGADINLFVDEADILNTIKTIEQGNPAGKPIGTFNLKKLETELEKDIWIKSAELFFDNNEVLLVNVQEREPIARIFTTGGNTFYIDEELTMLPLSEKFSAKLPVFTNFPSDTKMLSEPDSVLLEEIKSISTALQKDTFCMALIEQVDITPAMEFEMIPKIGNQLIRFGNGTNVDEKLGKLQLFYKEVMGKAGWNMYSVISVQYKNQVVAKKRGAEDMAADAQRALQIMQMLAERTRQQANDSLQIIQQDNERNTVDSTMIQQSIEREESAQPSYTFEKPKPQEAEGARPAPPSAGAVSTAKTPVKQNVRPAQQPAGPKTVKQQPKAVMQKHNEN
jgi:cell division protein FtsQ